jgi:hypothetical protein
MIVFVDLNVALTFIEMTKTYGWFAKISFHMAQVFQSKTKLCHREAVIVTITQIRFMV